LSTAILLVDSTGVILKANAAAQALCSDQSIVHVRERAVSFCDRQADQTIRVALSQRSGEPRFIPINGPGDAKLVVAILPIDAKTGLQAIFIHPQEPDSPSLARHIQELFGLTPREICVLLPLLEGKEISDIADQLGITRATAKSHLDRLFAKTGTNRQAELVQRVLKAIPPVRPG
jgi:DNA-binding CsgD family transcriptional regulator